MLLIVSSSRSNNTNILISNKLDIILKSMDIKTIVNKLNNKKYIKGFVYRIM
jgi:hypothetical protein